MRKMSSKRSQLEARDVDPKRRGPPVFGQVARELLHAGLVVVPCGRASGKVPLIPWCGLTHAALADRLPELIERYADANVGVICGPSGLVVVDIDEPGLLERMLQRFGETPLIVETPSGGFHAYYRLP